MQGAQADREGLEESGCALLDVRRLCARTPAGQLETGERATTSCAVFNLSLRYLPTLDSLTNLNGLGV